MLDRTAEVTAKNAADIAAMKVHVAEKYVTRGELRQDFKSINTKLDRINDKLDAKN